MIKKCYSCGENKNSLDFGILSRNKDGLQNICKICVRRKWKEYYENSEGKYRKRIYENSVQNRLDSRNRIVEIKKKLGCKFCGEKEPVCLDFHHIYDKIKNVADMTASCSWDTIEKEIEKCVILCANCHRKVHAGLLSI